MPLSKALDSTMSLTARLSLALVLDVGGDVAGADAEGGLAARVGGPDHGVAAGGEDERDARVVHERVGRLERRLLDPLDAVLGGAGGDRGVADHAGGGDASTAAALGWKAKTIGLRVLSAISALKIAVEVGLVTGRDAGDDADRLGDLGDAVDRRRALMTPTVFRRAMQWVTCSQAKMFLTALSSNTPRPVSSTASWASSPCWLSAATDAFLTMWSTCSWSRVRNCFSAP